MSYQIPRTDGRTSRREDGGHCGTDKVVQVDHDGRIGLGRWRLRPDRHGRSFARGGSNHPRFAKVQHVVNKGYGTNGKGLVGQGRIQLDVFLNAFLLPLHNISDGKGIEGLDTGWIGQPWIQSNQFQGSPSPSFVGIHFKVVNRNLGEGHVVDSGMRSNSRRQITTGLEHIVKMGSRNKLDSIGKAFKLLLAAVAEEGQGVS